MIQLIGLMIAFYIIARMTKELLEKGIFVQIVQCIAWLAAVIGVIGLLSTGSSPTTP